jgi:hypothetical protein
MQSLSLSKDVVENCNEECFRLHKCIYSAIINRI